MSLNLSTFLQNPTVSLTNIGQALVAPIQNENTKKALYNSALRSAVVTLICTGSLHLAVTAGTLAIAATYVSACILPKIQKIAQNVPSLKKYYFVLSLLQPAVLYTCAKLASIPVYTPFITAMAIYNCAHTYFDNKIKLRDICFLQPAFCFFL